MQENDKKKFSLLMRRLRVTFPISLSEKDEALRTEVYWQEFKSTSIEKFEYSVLEAISSLTFFPKPAELHEIIEARANQEYSSEGALRIEWMEPTEEGRRTAIEMIGELREKWKREDEKKEKERAERFEKNRANLKKQAKLLK